MPALCTSRKMARAIYIYLKVRHDHTVAGKDLVSVVQLLEILD